MAYADNPKEDRDHLRRATVLGEKVFLRSFERTDITDDYLDWVNDTRINTYILATGYPTNYERAVAYYEASQPPSAAYFAVCDIESGTHIGNARLSLIDPINRVATYGRIIGHQDYKRKGYGTDALVQLLRFGFHRLGINRIWSSAVEENIQSLGSNDKVGMVREGRLREYVYANGVFHDTIVLAMLRKDFDTLHGGPEEWVKRDRMVRDKYYAARSVKP